MSTIHLKQVKKSFGEKAVLQSLDLEIEKGDMFAIIGPSGSGKSTLLNIINGLLAPDEGDIEVLGTTLSFENGKDLEIRRQMAYILQKSVAFRGSVKDNVAYGLKIRGIEDTDERVMNALKLVGLEDLIHDNARTLSGGELQRMAFARAVIYSPSLLLLDEFTANLDPYNIRLLEDALSRYQNETGATVVIVTHNLFQAKRISKTSGFLYGGKIHEKGPTDKLFSDPADPKTRAFVNGEMIF